MNNEVSDEIILLVIIYNHIELMNELQITSKMFRSKDNMLILNAMKETIELNGVVDIETMASKLKNDIFTYFGVNVIGNEYYLDTNYKEQFISCQKRILDDFKIRVYEELSKQVVTKVISIEEYNEKISKMDKFNIISDINYIDEEELKNNIYISNKGIKFNKFIQLNNILKLFQNDLLVIGASTGVGKSGFMLNLMNDLMEQYQCIYFNIEMSKATIYRRLLAINQSIPVNAIDNPSDYQKDLIEKGIKNLSDKKIIIESQINNIQDLKMVISKVKDKGRHTIIFIDHIGLLKTTKSKSLYEQLTDIAKELRSICFDYDCTIIAASQLNRTSYNEENPTINMLKDSGELENSSRKVIILYRNSKSKKDDLVPIMNIDIQKNDTGRLGIIKMKYDKIKQVFEEVNEWKQET